VINSAAPIRICDNGGWTDTWFAGHGQVFNMAVCPLAEVQIQVFPRARRPESERAIIHAENFGDRYAPALGGSGWDRHPLLEATIQLMGIPDDVALEVSIFSQAPSGASTGTSAAVTVALIGALDRLTPGQLAPHEVAYLAHSIEVDTLKQQSGIQDQLCAAYGGINYIEILHYPGRPCLSSRCPTRLVGAGAAAGSDLPGPVAQLITGARTGHQRVGRCWSIWQAASRPAPGRDAIPRRCAICRLAGLGQAMIANTEAQGRLHSDLISADARCVIDIAREHGVLGWKVNGAGGEGGSLTLLCGPLSTARRAMVRDIEQESELFKNIPIHLSRHGLHTWE